MKITDVRVTIFQHPMPPLHGARWGGQQEISLVEVVTDEGIVGYGSARAQGGSGGRAIADPNLHASLAIPNCDWYEVLVPEDRYDFGLTSYPNPGTDGIVHAPTAPGLGIEIDWEWTRAHEVPL